MKAQPDLLAGIFGSGPLMITPDGLRDVAARIGQLDNAKVNEQHPAEFFARTSHKYEVVGGVAQFELAGPILGKPDWLLDAWAIDYTVSTHFAAAITEAAAREDVSQITITVDSPGGSVTGLQAAYEAVRDAGVPVVAVVEGLMASAALYMTAAADRIIAQPASIVGSIGTLVVVRDYSKLFEDIGITTHVISTGPHKGAGAMGAELTDEQIASIQSMVDELGEQFIAVVAEGRGMEIDAVHAIATGEVWVAPSAMQHGLVDVIESTPLAAASNIAKERAMLEKSSFKALLAAHPQHTDLIMSLDDEGKDQAEIEAAIVEADRKAEIDNAKAEAADAKAKLAEAEAKVTAAEAEAKAAADKLAACQAELDQVKAQLGEFQELGSQRNDPGSDGGNGSHGGSGNTKEIKRSEMGSMTKEDLEGLKAGTVIIIDG